MKLTLLLSLSSALSTLCSALPLDSPSNVSLGADLPDQRFRIHRKDETTFLPVEPALLNVLHFMSIVAVQDFDDQLFPRTYSAPGYRQVEITSFAYTEARYLLWGIYLATFEMVKFVRFHNTIVDLYWEDRLVGRMRIGLRNILTLPGSAASGTENLLDGSEQPNQTADSGSTSPSSTSEAVALHTEILASSHTAIGEFTDDLIGLWTSRGTNLSQSPTLPSTDSTLSASIFYVRFDRGVDAKAISRNDFFMTFYTGLLHAAKFNPDDLMVPFDSIAPTEDVKLDMYQTHHPCQVTLPPILIFLLCASSRRTR